MPRIPSSFYWKLSAACFVIGGCMELFMYHTGFYNVVTQKEAERFVENFEEQQLYRRKLLEHLRDKGFEAPAAGERLPGDGTKQ